MKLVEISFKRERPLRLVDPVATSASDSEPERTATKAIPNGKATKTKKEYKVELADGSLTQVVAYLADPRGIRYDYDPRTFRAPETRNVHDRTSFLLSTVLSTVLHVGLFDVCQTIIQTIPGTTVGSPKGGSIFIHSIPIPFRYIVSTAICLAMGTAVYAGLEAGHNLLTLFSVGICDADPADHPPMFWAPWTATSVRELWSKRWHAVFKNYFTYLGWAVGSSIFGDIGGVLGVFTLSGILHDWTIWGMGHGTDPWRIIGFFYLQGIAVIGESIWTQTTGKKVRGRWGHLWTATWMLATAHLVVEAWMQKGIAGGSYFLGDNRRPFLWIRNYITQS